MAALENLLSADRMWRVLVATGYLMIPAVPAEAQNGSSEQASAAFIQQYIREWAGPAPAALAYMDQLYPDQTDFYGKSLTHEELMNLKRKFVMRWPERTLSIRPDSVQASCDPNHLCSVQANFDWQYRSPERQASSSGSSSLKLVLLDGTTILSENGAAVPASAQAPPDPAQRRPVTAKATQPEARPDVPTVAAAEASPQRRTQSPRQDEPNPPLEELGPQRDNIAVLRQAYAAHAADKDWIAGWLAQKRDFSSQATYVGFTEDQAGPGSAGALRTVDFTSAAGPVACVNPDNANLLKAGQTVSIHGMITIFIGDVMYLGQCSIQPG